MNSWFARVRSKAAIFVVNTIIFFVENFLENIVLFPVREMLLFSITDMAAVTSRTSQQKEKR